MGFLLLVMLVIGVFIEVRQLSYTSSGFITMITIVFLEAPGGNTQLVGMLCLLYGLCNKGQISFKMT